MPENKRKKAYLTYDDNETTRGKLLRTGKKVGSVITVDGKQHKTNNVMNKTLENHLIDQRGAEITHFERIYDRGKDYLFSVPDTRSKVIKIDGESYIQVRIIAETVESLFLKLGQIKSEMRNSGVIEKMCTWDRVGDLEIDINETQKTIPEFSFDEVKSRKLLELQTSRQN
jgi:hypothetical protein